MTDAVILMTVPPEKRKEILQTIKAILGAIRLERGCKSCNCYVDVESENVFYFLEEWGTAEDLNAHLESVHFHVLIGAMKLLKEEPTIIFKTIASTAGAEAIRQARS
ncbi:MAG: antibiotic biosynthesis monooxygenase [Deltaproteobacteria bacterium]|nr:antibiotic biosynthesis monooxygenase [Deltaproteobacteria bacterium]